MIIQKVKKDKGFAESKLYEILNRIHTEGPIYPHDLEILSYIKFFHDDLFCLHESQLIYFLGLFYKTSAPSTVIEKIYSLYSELIEEETSRQFTPVQASAYKQIQERKFFSFSAPTSSGKSYLFRELIKEYDKDIIIVVPSRALIAEYMFEVLNLVKKDVLVLQFIENMT